MIDEINVGWHFCLLVCPALTGYGTLSKWLCILNPNSDAFQYPQLILPTWRHFVMWVLYAFFDLILSEVLKWHLSSDLLVAQVRHLYTLQWWHLKILKMIVGPGSWESPSDSEHLLSWAFVWVLKLSQIGCNTIWNSNFESFKLKLWISNAMVTNL